MSDNYTFDGDYVPIAYDTHPDYYDLSLPPTYKLDGETLMEWMDFQESMLPKYVRDNPDVWSIYDLEGYQALVLLYINMKAAEDRYGKSIHSKDRPFITGEIKKSLR
jgi:hypothetical protein